MSEYGDLVKAKCDAFADRVVKLNDYLLKEAANQRADVRWLKAETRAEVRGKEADYKSKSYIALKEARESLYWINLLHRNGYLDDNQYDSIYADADELVRILVARCKKLDAESVKE